MHFLPNIFITCKECGGKRYNRETLDVIKVSDWVIDLGPEGGEKRGEVIAAGSPEDVSMVERSYTGQYMRKVLGNQSRVMRRAAGNGIRNSIRA